MLVAKNYSSNIPVLPSHSRIMGFPTRSVDYPVFALQQLRSCTTSAEFELVAMVKHRELRESTKTFQKPGCQKQNKEV